jgi:hypothetical protein
VNNKENEIISAEQTENNVDAVETAAPTNESESI